MNFFEVVDKRRSVRRFTESEVPESVMRKCLKAAILAPNSSNLQPWEFYWIRDEEKKKKVFTFDQVEEAIDFMKQMSLWLQGK